MAIQEKKDNVKRFISHRGNLDGKNTELENQPSYIYEAINKGFEVEVDVWFVDGKFKLGHDKPHYDFPFELLKNHYKNLWLHCKNLDAVVAFSQFNNDNLVNYFWHQKDDITLTSKGYIWAFPGKQPIKNSIAVLPEIYNDDISSAYGICSDIILDYKK